MFLFWFEFFYYFVASIWEYKDKNLIWLKVINTNLLISTSYFTYLFKFFFLSGVNVQVNRIEWYEMVNWQPPLTERFDNDFPSGLKFLVPLMGAFFMEKIKLSLIWKNSKKSQLISLLCVALNPFGNLCFEFRLCQLSSSLWKKHCLKLKSRIWKAWISFWYKFKFLEGAKKTFEFDMMIKVRI